jgi:hypothetical protein
MKHALIDSELALRVPKSEEDENRYPQTKNPAKDAGSCPRPNGHGNPHEPPRHPGASLSIQSARLRPVCVRPSRGVQLPRELARIIRRFDHRNAGCVEVHGR